MPRKNYGLKSLIKYKLFKLFNIEALEYAGKGFIIKTAEKEELHEGEAYS